MVKQRFEKEVVIKIVKDVLEILEDRALQNKYRIRDLTAMLTQYQNELFHLVVCGNGGTGKTSLINALIEKSVLPVGEHLHTSIIFRISYGQIPKYTVFFASTNSDPQSVESIEISEDQLREYGTTIGSKTKNVAQIAIELPVPLLESGLVILDTPGLRSLFEDHSQITWSYVLPYADCGIFVFGSARSASENELGNLERFCNNAIRVHNTGLSLGFVQTKIDEHSPESWCSIRDQNLKRIAYRLSLSKEEMLANYFTVSSLAKELAAQNDNNPDYLKYSGFNPLSEYLQRIITSKEDISASNLLMKAYTAMTEHNQLIHVDIQTNKRATNDNQSETYGEILKLQEKVQGDLVNWEHHKYLAIKRNFEFNYRKIHTTAKRELTDEISESNLIEPIIKKLKKTLSENESIRQSTIKKEVSDAWKKYQSSFIKNCEKKIPNIINKFSKDKDTLITELESEIKCSFNEVITPFIETVEEKFETSVDKEDVSESSLLSPKAFNPPEDYLKIPETNLKTHLTRREQMRLVLGDSILSSFGAGGIGGIIVVAKAVVSGDYSNVPEVVDRAVEAVREKVEKKSEESFLDKGWSVAGKVSDDMVEGAKYGAPLGALGGLAGGVNNIKQEFIKKVTVEIQSKLGEMLKEAKETCNRELNDYIDAIWYDLENCLDDVKVDLGEIWKCMVKDVKKLMESDSEEIHAEIIRLEQKSESLMEYIIKIETMLNPEAE